MPELRRGANGASDYLDREGRAIRLLAQCIGDIVGVRSEAYKTLVRAAASDNPLDLHLAQASFEALDAAVRRRIRDRVRDLGAAAARGPLAPG